MDFLKLPFMQCVTQLQVNENILQSFKSEVKWVDWIIETSCF